MPVTVFFVWHTDTEFVVTWFYSTSCGVFTISKISLFQGDVSLLSWTQGSLYFIREVRLEFIFSRIIIHIFVEMVIPD